MSAPGLSTPEAERLLEQVGPNEVAQRGRTSTWSRVLAQLRDPLVLVLLAACVLTTATGDFTDAAVIAFVVVVNTAVGVSQAQRADRAITSLAALTTPSVRVRRDGAEVSVPASTLVPGDVVVLGEGDVVPADCDLVDASSVLVDEAALTGESVAVAKSVPGELLSGTVVVTGRAVATVRRTGAASALGRIAELMDTRVQPTPLQLRLAGLGRTLALVAVVLSLVVLVSGVLRGQPWELMVVTAISLAVAAVPESLPAVVTFSLALGARRMAARHAIVRRLPAVETLGSVTVLATDKTGTLTQAQMFVERLWTPRSTVSVSGEGYSPSGVLTGAAGPLDPDRAPDVVELLRACVLCNDASLVPPGTGSTTWGGLGDPTEVALLSVAAKAGLLRERLAVGHPRVHERPFSSSAQQMTTAHLLDPSDPTCLLVVSKGSVEALERTHATPAYAAVWAEARAQATLMAEQGFRVLAVTAGEVPAGPGWEAADQRLLGLVAMGDPVRPTARATLEECRAAGIVPVLITGDHPATAGAVAVRVGILSAAEAAREGAVVEGADIVAGRVGDLTEPRVFARTSPEQKLDVVAAWQDAGAVVAMTGDGVNDGPALHRSDIGVAMGRRGTEVARQAADLVLADDELATVVLAVREGRRVYANIRLFLVFGLSGGAAEILVMLLGPAVGLTVPLLAAQILWINLLTHGTTGVALGAEPSEAGAMRRLPRPPEQSVLGDGLWQRVVVLGTAIAVACLLLGGWARLGGREWQTMLFLALTCLQLGVALGLRPVLLTRANPLLPVAVTASLALALAGVYVPVLQELLGTHALPAVDALLASSTVLVGGYAARLTRPRTARPRGRHGRHETVDVACRTP